MANTEQIEAKLCAYVDGELDAAGRAEIEQHLAANPQHRALLAELMEQRELLRDLPRETAPEELTEALQAHLERSVLLGSGQGPQVAGKINHRPQFLALAAVLLLAIGLVAVILMVLPDHNKLIHNYAVLPTTTTAPSATLTRDAGDLSLTPTTTVADDTTSRQRLPEGGRQNPTRYISRRVTGNDCSRRSAEIHRIGVKYAAGRSNADDANDARVRR